MVGGRVRCGICLRGAGVGQAGLTLCAYAMFEVAREFGIVWRTVMAAARDQGTSRVEDPARLDGEEAVGPDETVFQAASARLLDVIKDRSASVLSGWMTQRISPGEPASA